MTVYAICRQKFIPFRLTLPLFFIRAWFCEANRRGILSVVLITVVIVSLTVYLSALFLTFHLGFAIQEKDGKLMEAKDLLISLELEARKISAEFTKVHGDILTGMEKISEIEYVLPRSVVDSHAIITR